MRFQTWLEGLVVLILWQGQLGPLRGFWYEAWWILLTLWLTVGLLSCFIAWTWRKMQHRSNPAPPDLQAILAERLRAGATGRIARPAPGAPGP
jgi:hypothetical protein